MIQREADLLAARLTQLRALLEFLATESTTARRKYEQIQQEIEEVRARLRALTQVPHAH